MVKEVLASHTQTMGEMTEVEKLALEIRSILNALCVLCFIVGAWYLTRYYFDLQLDETDRKNGLRSNMELRIDYGTGLHYLESKGGYLIPRLDEFGLQIKEME